MWLRVLSQKLMRFLASFFFSTLKNVLVFTTDSPASLCSSPSKHPHTASKLAQYATQGVGRPGCRGRMTNSGAPPGHASGVGRWEVEVRWGGALTAKNPATQEVCRGQKLGKPQVHIVDGAREFSQAFLAP